MKLRLLWCACVFGSFFALSVGPTLPGRIVMGQERLPQEPAGGDGFFVETFDGPVLDASWFWVREDADFWNLAERPGWLRIYTQYGSLDGGQADNVLLRPAPAVPYTLTSHFEFNPTLDFHEASLLIYDDDDNYVKMSRLEHSVLGGSRYLLTREVNGVKEQGSYIFTDQTAITLRLAVYPNRVFGWYLDSAGEWRILGTIHIESAADYPYVGLTAHSGLTVGDPPPSIPADFDFIETGAAIPLVDQFLPLGVYR